MAFEFKFADVGEGITEGEIVKWLVKVGDKVKADQPVAQIETDKAVVELPSPVEGVVKELKFNEGDKVKVGQTLVVLETKDNGSVKEKKAREEKRDARQAKEDKTAVVGKLEEQARVPQTLLMRAPVASKKILASPKVRMLAHELGVDLKAIKPSGANGRVTESDVRRAASRAPGLSRAEVPAQKVVVKKKFDDFGPIEHVEVKGIRKTIAHNVSKTWREVPQVTLTDEIAVDKLLQVREKEKEKMAKKGVKLTPLAFIVKACVLALKENPLLNASWQGEEIVLKKYYNIGIAVETEAGLMVPVIKIAENKSIEKIAREIEELAKKARERTIDLMDLKGSTFTITNYGSIGGKFGTPIINGEESAILGLGRIEERASVKKGKLKITKFLPVSLTFDHRVADGAQAARFVETLKFYLQDPSHLLVELR
ncbi:2-oxo acid dehydrogenase subunit E2 [Candidatus Pacearchaeota archaeon]|nr:MAG: 2-oxo acid dehydrogenase subunit E2 [Candidatus Pacearchaeota archaeon]